mmetsp:Transcript_19141/g.41220  ORF Transcript_19141/g.41220 Transcript_19141/m.41220 type:complete len:242 (-) Transcript_19141:116-841(-)
MVRTLAALITVVPLLQGVAGSSMLDSAQTGLDKMTSYMGSASSHIDTAKATLDGHVQKAKSLKAQAESVFCKVPGISSLSSCKEEVAAAAAEACSGPGCCPKSSCLTNSLPMVKCDASRGTTSCVGASIFSMKEGVCECKVGSCSIDGKCANAPAPTAAPSEAQWAASDSSILRYDLGSFNEAVPRENFVLVVAGFFCFSGAMIILGVTFAVRTLRRRTASSGVSIEMAEEDLLEASAAVE